MTESKPDVTRCEVCDWPLATSASEGCVPGNCAFRPREGSEDWRRIKQRRAELKLRENDRRVAAIAALDDVAAVIDRMRGEMTAKLESGT